MLLAIVAVRLKRFSSTQVSQGFDNFMLVQICILMFAATSHQVQPSSWLASWPKIVHSAPVAYYLTEVGSGKTRFNFVDRSGKVVGSVTPPDKCNDIRTSPDKHYAAFLCPASVEERLYNVVVTDDLGHVASANVPIFGGGIVWTTKDTLAVYSSDPLMGTVPNQIGGEAKHIDIKVVRVLEPVSYLRRCSLGGERAFVAFNDDRVLGTIVLPPPPGEGGFWLNSSLAKSQKFLVGQQLDSLCVSPDSRYIASTMPNGVDECLTIWRTSDEHIVFQRAWPHDLIEYGVTRWSPTGHTLTAGIAAWKGGSMWVYKADKSKFSSFKSPAGLPWTFVWVGPNEVLAAVCKSKDSIERLYLFNTKSGIWKSLGTQLPKGAHFTPLE